MFSPSKYVVGFLWCPLYFYFLIELFMFTRLLSSSSILPNGDPQIPLIAIWNKQTGICCPSFMVSITFTFWYQHRLPLPINKRFQQLVFTWLPFQEPAIFFKSLPVMVSSWQVSAIPLKLIRRFLSEITYNANGFWNVSAAKFVTLFSWNLKVKNSFKLYTPVLVDFSVSLEGKIKF